jgi:hypothetical protein
LAPVWYKVGPFDLRTNKKAPTPEIRAFDQPPYQERCKTPLHPLVMSGGERLYPCRQT